MSQEITDPVTSLMDPPSEAPQMNHGRTLAGWFLFWAVCVGVLIIAAGAIAYNWTIIWAGAAVVAAGVIISVVLRVMGHGQPVKGRQTPSVEDL